MPERFDVAVVGAGYVGLVTGASLAHLGHRVTCLDRDEARIAELEAGGMPIYEPGLPELAARGRETGRLSFAGAGELDRVVAEARFLFVAVGTPQGEDGAADLSNVAAVARSIGRALVESAEGREQPLVVVNKSTVPVGSGDYVSALIREGAAEAGAGFAADYRVVSNPEFLREGSAVRDSLFPDRLVLGSGRRDALDAMRELYEPVIEQSFHTELDPRPRNAVPFVTTDLASAEMIKYAANAFLATKISFANEIANICELVGADAASVAHGMGLDERIGPRFLNAGVGWGGSCFPKDVSALRAIAREYDHETPLLAATVAVNEGQRRRVISRLQAELDTLEGKLVALLGLSFKPNTDDLRDAPSLEIAGLLLARGARVVGYDPVSGKAAARLEPELGIASGPYEALDGAHAAVLVTEWEELRALDLGIAASLMAPPRLVVDGRNALDPEAARRSGLFYRGFGRS